MTLSLLKQAKTLLSKLLLVSLDYLRLKDALITQLFFFKAFLNYHLSNGNSRGSYLIMRETLNDSLSERYITPPAILGGYKFIVNDNDLTRKIQTLQLQNDKIKVEWEQVRDIPMITGWFETVWKKYSNGDIFK